jgi:NitT/TauT family transport system ATP-binding protein
MPADVKLAVERITKYFLVKRETGERVHALDDCSFTVADGEVVALIGSSGCGKTTLLKIIHGLIPADEGAIRIDDRVVHGPGHDRGMVFQHAGLLPWRTAVENVEFGLEIKKVPKQERRAIAERFIEIVGLTGFEDRHPHQLSGGMRQRIGLARALAIDPEVLLMDEPFGALDAQTKELLQAELSRIQAATGKTILFVTHDLDEAVYLADRVVVMSPRPGRIREDVEINIPRPRPEVAVVKQTQEFIAKRTHIWQSLSAVRLPDEDAA